MVKLTSLVWVCRVDQSWLWLASMRLLKLCLIHIIQTLSSVQPCLDTFLNGILEPRKSLSVAVEQLSERTDLSQFRRVVSPKTAINIQSTVFQSSATITSTQSWVLVMMVRCAIGDLLYSLIPNHSVSSACLRIQPTQAKQFKRLRVQSLVVPIDSRSMLIALISRRASRSTSMLVQKISTFISAIRGNKVPFKEHTKITMHQSLQFTSIQVLVRVKSTERCLSCSSQVPWIGQ